MSLSLVWGCTCGHDFVSDATRAIPCSDLTQLFLGVCCMVPYKCCFVCMSFPFTHVTLLPCGADVTLAGCIWRHAYFGNVSCSRLTHVDMIWASTPYGPFKQLLYTVVVVCLCKVAYNGCFECMSFPVTHVTMLPCVADGI